MRLENLGRHSGGSPELQAGADPDVADIDAADDALGAGRAASLRSLVSTG